MKKDDLVTYNNQPYILMYDFYDFKHIQYAVIYNLYTQINEVVRLKDIEPLTTLSLDSHWKAKYIDKQWVLFYYNDKGEQHYIESYNTFALLYRVWSILHSGIKLPYENDPTLINTLEEQDDTLL